MRADRDRARRARSASAALWLAALAACATPARAPLVDAGHPAHADAATGPLGGVPAVLGAAGEFVAPAEKESAEAAHPAHGHAAPDPATLDHPTHGEQDPGGPHVDGTPAAGGFACPMHPEIRSDAPGSCPRCGMDLEPVDPDGGGGRP